eukprot:TRINITY_DN30935_c0_g1_i1.p1 TRINITY_DN30935_c0_g1~~TRINITY_DN30935_c0_g1_i1.p1  ORF type:complete len:367 (-),score=36.60 TRINITY_DN30935_c0_g1_i1:130-1230(-)
MAPAVRKYVDEENGHITDVEAVTIELKSKHHEQSIGEQVINAFSFVSKETPQQPAKKSDHITPLSWFCLLALVLQNSSAVLIMRWTLVRKGEREYLPASAVVVSEMIKTCASLLLVLWEHGTLAGCYANKPELLKTSIPAILYLAQNNLQYLAVRSLHAGTYQTIYQLKVMTTAVVWVIVFQTSLGKVKWLCLAVLVAGVACVQISDSGAASNTISNPVNLPLGTAATIAATLTSAAAGVYFEKLLKHNSTLSLWQRNAQLGMYSVIFGLVGILSVPSSASLVIQNGPFHGFTRITCISCLIQGGGGLLIGLIMKYTNAIMKDMATTVSILLSVYLSWFIFDQPIGDLFIVGVALVTTAVFGYARS